MGNPAAFEHGLEYPAATWETLGRGTWVGLELALAVWFQGVCCGQDAGAGFGIFAREWFMIE